MFTWKTAKSTSKEALVEDESDVSVVGEWSQALAAGKRWHAPLHNVSDDSWKSAFNFHNKLGSGGARPPAREGGRARASSCRRLRTRTRASPRARASACAGFGSVTLATHIKSGTDVAVKLVFDRSEGGKPTAKSESVRNEIETLRRMSHPAIVSLAEVFAQKPEPQEADPTAPWVRRWWLVLELCEGDDLQQLLLRRGALELGVCKQIFAQMVNAIEYMHWRGGNAPSIAARAPPARRLTDGRARATARVRAVAAVLHRDIKPANIMVLGSDADAEHPIPPSPRIKLLDFGLAEAIDEARIAEYRKRTAAHAQKTGAALPPTLKTQDTFSAATFASSASPSNSSRGRRASTFRSPMRRASTVKLAAQPSMLAIDLAPQGTAEFGAPEVFDESRFQTDASAVGGVVDGVVVKTSMVVDSYGLGATLRYMLTGVPPTVESAHLHAYVSLRRLNPLRACAGKRVYVLHTFDELPLDAQELLDGLLRPVPEERLGMSALRTHPWVDDDGRGRL